MIPKRMFWSAAGYGAGIATSMYVQRKVRRAVTRYAPAEVREQVTTVATGAVDRAKGLGATVKAAAAEGRTAMRTEEAQLRQQFAPGVRPEPAARRHRPVRR